MRKGVLATVATLIATLALLAVFATPANASYSQCPGGVSCLYAGENGAGSPTNVPFSTYHDGKCHDITLQPVGGFHSAIGQYGAPYTLELWNGTGCSSGWLATLSAGQKWTDAFHPVGSFQIE